MSAVLKSLYDKQDDIPEAFRPLFSERNGKFELSGIEGVKAEAAFTAVQEALRKEREDHGKVKKDFGSFSALGKSADELQQLLDRLPELEAAAAGKKEQLTEAQKNALVQPLQRELVQIKGEHAKLLEEVNTLKGEKRTRTIHDAVRAVFTEMKGLPSALDDALMYAERVFEVTDDGKVQTRDNVGVVPGLDPKLWLQDVQQKKAHWWPPSQGGGAGGSGGGGVLGGKNPWSKDHWNVTAQGQYVKEHGVDKAKAAAQAVGSAVGAIAPPAK